MTTEMTPERVAEYARNYEWLRDVALCVVIAGPVVCMADAWGRPETGRRGETVLLDGDELDEAIARARQAFDEQMRRNK